MLISQPYDDPPPPLPLEWIQKPNPQRDVVTTQPLGRVEENEDICLTICKLLKRLRAVKIAENKMLFDEQGTEEDNQTHCLKLKGGTKILKEEKKTHLFN